MLRLQSFYGPARSLLCLTRYASTSGPSKESLLTLDWMFEGLMPNFMKNQLGPVFARMTPDVVFEDKVYGYNMKGVSSLNFHLLKIRSYFRYKSPFVQMEYKGSVIYEGEDVMTLLWKLSFLRSSFLRYFPSFLTGKKTEMNVYEGALDISVNSDGKIYKMINRKVTPEDQHGAELFLKLKKESAEEKDKRAAELKTLEEN